MSYGRAELVFVNIAPDTANIDPSLADSAVISPARSSRLRLRMSVLRRIDYFPFGEDFVVQERAADALIDLLWGIRTRRDVGINVLCEEFESHCLLEAVTSEVRGDDSYIDVALAICLPASVGSKQDGPSNSDVVLAKCLHVLSYEPFN